MELKQEYANLLRKYTAAITKTKTYIEILEKDYETRYNYCPIDHITSRLKTFDSTMEKMKRHKRNEDIKTIEEKITDIAGIRVVCHFEHDVDIIVKLIKEDKSLKVIKEKDYIKDPKRNGYRSYHMVILQKVHLIDGDIFVPVEIQIRTLAQDFWAALEHQIVYKYKGMVPAEIQEELKDCSDVADLLDKKMQVLSKKIQEQNEN